MLEDTSYAILPSTNQESEEILHSVGSVQSVEWDGSVLRGNLEKGKFILYFLQNKVVRVEVNPFGDASGETTLAVQQDEPLEDVNFSETEQTVTLLMGKYQVVVNKHPFSIKIQKQKEVLFQTACPCVVYNSAKHVLLSLYKKSDAPVYGLGEKSGFLNKNGANISNWNTDVFAPHNKDTVELYQSIPFALIHEPGKVSTGLFFDNSYRTTFDMQRYKDRMTIRAEGGTANAYIILGDDIKDTVSRYTLITGTTPLPPKWSLGYHQSRYSYTSQEEVTRIADTFLQYNIPLDCIFLDIHYMDGYRVFTFNEDRFPQAKELIHDLKKRGIDVVPIVDPGVKQDVQYSIYQEGMKNGYFSKYMNGDIYLGEVWPGQSAFPDFFQRSVQKWWGHLHQFYTEKGVRGIWNDMNEPSVFNESKTMDINVMHDKDGQLISHKEGHNLYGLYMSKATFEGLQKLLPNTRPFSLTRAGYAGVQRYSTVWTGDNRSHWEHLEMSLPMIMNLGISGVAFCGADIGGFSSDTTPELLIRWTQAGAFSPYFRNHSVQDSIYQEPWAFGEDTMASVRKYIELRYRFLPYIYTLFYEAEQIGTPIVRPLVMEYPEDKETVECSDQFMVGSQVMIAPMLRPGQSYRAVYFPAGVWYDWWTEEKIKGGQYQLVSADIDTLPIFVKEGTVLPLGTSVKNTKDMQHIELAAFYSDKEEMAGTLYEDDTISYEYRKGNYRISNITITKNGEVNMKASGNSDSKTILKDVKIIGKK